MDEKSLIVVITTCGSQDEAEKIAKVLVEKRVAACSQVSGPITSFYWWNKNLERDEEWQVKFKMPEENFERASMLIRQNHSYELPQIVAIKVNKALDEYAEWIMIETKGKA